LIKCEWKKSNLILKKKLFIFFLQRTPDNSYTKRDIRVRV
jgi:hypothetical protein